MYFIEYSVDCTDMYEEYNYYVGTCAFINPDKMDKTELLEFAYKMAEDFEKDRSKDWRANRGTLLTIGEIVGEDHHILYSSVSARTDVSEIGEPLDTIPALPKHLLQDIFTIYRDDYPEDNDYLEDNDIESNSDSEE